MPKKWLFTLFPRSEERVIERLSDDRVSVNEISFKQWLFTLFPRSEERVIERLSDDRVSK